jgi:hypothetical protein
MGAGARAADSRRLGRELTMPNTVRPHRVLAEKPGKALRREIRETVTLKKVATV